MNRLWMCAVFATACTAVVDDSADQRSRPALRTIELELPRLSGEPVSDTVHWRFMTNDGELIEGDAIDPGLVRSEFDEHGHPAPVVTKLPWPARVVVPVLDRDGTLEVLREGRAVAHAPVRAGQASTQQPIADWSDVLGPPTRVIARTVPGPDVLIVSEGFTAAQMPAFRALISDLTPRLVAQSQLPVPGSLGFLVQEVVSRESGADDPATSTFVDTAFDTTYGFGGTDRCLMFGTPEGFGLADSLRQSAGASVVIAIVNSSKHGGCASGSVATYNVPTGEMRLDELAGGVHHEVGHALFNLADEYDDGPCRPFSPRANVSNSLSTPWADLVPRGVPIPTLDSKHLVGVFEGAQYCVTGKYRSSALCRMRTSDRAYCDVCQRERERILRSWSGATIEREPNGSVTSAQLIQPIDSVRGVTGSDADGLDFYKVNGPTGECTTVQLFPPAGTDLDLSLTDSVGKVLKTSAKVGLGVREIATQCGPFAIAVKYRSGAVGPGAAYRLEVSY